MADLTPKEHLQPSLLDRLTDSNPDGKTDTLDERVMSFRRLRESVIRDLEWLLNTGRLEISGELGSHPEVRKSVLNYGIPDISGISIASRDSESIAQDIRQAILDLSQILPTTLKVSIAVDDTRKNEDTMILEIQGELWWQPLPERFYLKATLDLDSWKFKREQ